MKAKFILLACVSVALFSCNKSKTPSAHIEYNGKFYKEPVPVQYDSNGDGVINELDEVIEVLGNNLNVSAAPKDKPLYKVDEEITPPGSPTGSGTLVETGKKYCYYDLNRNCDNYGALYAFETTVNTNKESIKEINPQTSADKDDDGVLDYINYLRNSIDSIAQSYADLYATTADELIEQHTKKQISTQLIKNEISTAVTTTLQQSLYNSDDYVDLSEIEQKLSVAIAQAVKDAVKTANLDSYFTEEELQNLAFEVSAPASTEATNTLASYIANTIVAEYQNLKESGNYEVVQGVCPEGYFIPSDIDWMMFELALGMPAEDITKYGVSVTDRGAKAEVVKKMVENHGFEYSGYVSINGTFAQLDEAGVFWSSTVGTDELGDYVWVRQIDKSYSGVVRYKHYEKSGLSIRCFKK